VRVEGLPLSSSPQLEEETHEVNESGLHYAGPDEDPSQQPFRKSALLLCLNTNQLKHTSTVEMEVSLWGPNFGSRRVFSVVYFRMPPVTLIIASRWSTTDQLTGQDLEGSGRSITEVLSQHVLGVCEENYEKPHSGLPMTRPIFQPRSSKIQIQSAKLHQ
jgi:hypothetical protein